MNVKYFYQNGNHSWRHESIITPLTVAISKVIELPEIIEVCLYDLGKSVYGGIDMIYHNRLGLSYNLPYDSVPIILSHELIHIHQKHTGILRITRKGEYYWHGVLHTKKLKEDLPYEEYMQLPWEHDAYTKQHKVLSQALSFLAT